MQISTDPDHFKLATFPKIDIDDILCNGNDYLREEEEWKS